MSDSPLKQVIVMQGIPGAGKSTLAKKHRDWFTSGRCKVVSADYYHITDNGSYVYKLENAAAAAHNCCLRMFIEEIQTSPTLDDHLVIVDNTNTTVADIAPYVAVACAYGYQVFIQRVTCPIEVALARCVHGVPREVVLRLQAQLDMFIPPARWDVRVWRDSAHDRA